MQSRISSRVVALAAILVTSASVDVVQDAGDLYVANIRSNEVTVYDGVSGAFRGVVVSGAGELTGATGIDFGPDGHLYVASSRTNRILRYDGATGEPLGPFVDDSALAMPFSILFGPDGHLYVSSGRGNAVRRYDGRSGAFLNEAAADDSLRQPIGLAFDSDGRLYVANSVGGNVMRFDPETGRGRVFAADSMGFPSDLRLRARRRPLRVERIAGDRCTIRSGVRQLSVCLRPPARRVGPRGSRLHVRRSPVHRRFRG